MKAKNLTMSAQQPCRKKQGTAKKLVQSLSQVVFAADGAYAPDTCSWQLPRFLRAPTASCPLAGSPAFDEPRHLLECPPSDQPRLAGINLGPLPCQAVNRYM